MSSGFEIGGQQAVRVSLSSGRDLYLLVTALSSRVGDIEFAVRDRRLTHERIAQPLFPNDLAGFFVHDEHSVALGIEADISGFDYSRGRAVVVGIDLPSDLAGVRVEGVELMRFVAAANEQHAVGIGRRGDGTSAGHTDDPT